MAGAFAAATSLAGLQAVLDAIPETVPLEAEANQSAARDAFDRVILLRGEPQGVLGAR
jgi:Pyruvate/2-oxoacid:ferredoxin oxidoreductase gamma subunit